MGVDGGLRWTFCHHWVMEWARLAQAIIDRRVELGFRTRESFVTAKGLSSRLMGDLERAGRENYDGATLARVEQALEWPSGRARAILRGTEGPDTSTLPQVVQDIAFLLTPGTGLTDRDRANLRQGLESLTALWLNLAAMGGTPDFSFREVDVPMPSSVPESERVPPARPAGR